MLPIAKIPPGIAFKAGQENIHAGRAQFYRMRYGDYLIGMNTTTDKTFTLAWPEGVSGARELVRERNITAGEPLKVGPRSTVVIARGKQLITVLDRLMRYRDDLVVLAQAQTALAGVDNASRLKAVNDASRQVVNRLIDEVVQQRQRTIESYQEGLASIADTVR